MYLAIFYLSNLYVNLSLKNSKFVLETILLRNKSY